MKRSKAVPLQIVFFGVTLIATALNPGSALMVLCAVVTGLSLVVTVIFGSD